MNLESIGWDSITQYYYDELKTEFLPARIASEDKGSYMLLTEVGELRAKISGAFRYTSNDRADLPVVGDWVLVEFYSVDSVAIIHKILPRKTLLLRKVAGVVTGQQALASNVDYGFIVVGLDHDFNLRRIERYITLIYDSGAQPVIVLNKVDLLDDANQIEEVKCEVEATALGVSIHFISATNQNSLTELKQYFVDNKTVVLLGSSGAGKSTLTNKLLGEEQQKTNTIRVADSKGRHTTTRRQLFLLAEGGIIIDTPGIRELQLWLEDSSFATSFPDIEQLAKNCRFHDCAHMQEPGCAVKAAIEQGILDENRLQNYHKLLREAKYLAKRQAEASWETRADDRKFGKMCRQVLKDKEKIRQK